MVNNAERWDLGYEHAKRYFEVHWDLDVPQRYVCEDGYRLGGWISAQRRSHKNGRLPAERARLLEVLGLKWSLPRGRSARAVKT